MKVNVNLNELEQALIVEHNKIRKDPKSYLEILRKHLKEYLKDNVVVIPNEISMKLIDGEKGYLEAIEYLENQEPVPELILDQLICQACKDHSEELGKNNLFTHESLNGLTVAERVEKYLEWDGACCETIEFGNRTAQSILVALLIDDGIPHRPHRNTIFSTEIKHFGVAISEHKSYGVCTVINYIASIRKEGDNQPFNYSEFQYKIRNNGIPQIRVECEEKKPRSLYAQDDPDAPDDTVSVQIKKVIKTINDKVKKVTKKIYTLENGTYHIVESEE